MGTQLEQTCVQIPRAEAIARLNDALRKEGRGGAIMITRGVRSLPLFRPTELLQALGAYTAFDPANDPHGERDFGDLTLFGEDLLWKIDYYDSDLKFGSDDPADPSKTQRVLTVMMASEY